MATLKCLACGRDNNIGDESCTSCSSSLNLKLCSACEAINAHSAERCHSCGAVFDPEPAKPETQPTKPETQPAEPLELDNAVPYVEIPATRRSLPAMRVVGDVSSASPNTRRSVVLWLVPVALVSAAATHYYHVGLPQAAPSTAVVPTTQPAKELASPAKPAEANAKVSTPKTANVSVMQSNAGPEPKRAASGVTHTRAGEGAAAAVAEPAAASKEALAKPVAAPAPRALSAPVVAPPPVAPPAGQVRVTHTRAPEPGEATASAGAASAAVASVPVPVEAPKSQSAGCPPAVAALGLCINK